MGGIFPFPPKGKNNMTHLKSKDINVVKEMNN